MIKRHFVSIFYFTLALLVYLQVAFPKLIPIGVLVLLVVVILGYQTKNLVFTIKKPLLLMGLLYIAYGIAYVFTRNPELANFYLMNKLTFLLFPLLFMFQTRFQIQLAPIFIALTIGVIQVGILGFIHSIQCHQESALGFDCFKSSSFSHLHHPSYFAMYILLAIYGVWLGFRQKWPYFKRWWIIPITVLFLAFYILCFSLAGLLFGCFLVLFLALRWIKKKYGKIAYFSVMVVGPVLLLIVLLSIPRHSDEIDSTIDSTVKYLKDPISYVREKTDYHYHTGSDIRLILWTVSTKLMIENPLGLGLANIDVAMEKELLGFGQTQIASNHYNPHNQYLQTGLELGLIGIIILIGLFWSLIRWGRQNKHSLMILLVSFFAFNALFESVFQRQSGTVFFALLVCVLMIQQVKKESFERLDGVGE
jgi:O-antigen ligase